MPVDTDPAVERLLIAAARAMPGWRKLRIVRDLNNTARRLQWAELRSRYPEAPGEELRLRLLSRWLEPELMRRLFGWDPRQEGY